MEKLTISSTPKYVLRTQVQCPIDLCAMYCSRGGFSRLPAYVLLSYACSRGELLKGWGIVTVRLGQLQLFGEHDHPALRDLHIRDATLI